MNEHGENQYRCVAPDVKLGSGVKLAKFINLYGCEIGDETKVGTFVEIQKNAKVGRRCKISSHTFICEGVTVEDHVFIGHSVTFINDSLPRATNPIGALQTEADWKVETTLVRRGASIGSGATILSNVVIGENAVVGAGSVVTHNVPANAIVAGNPARFLRSLSPEGRIPHADDQVPFLDLTTVHRELKEELMAVFETAIETSGLVGGPMVQGFEHEFAEFCQSRCCVGAANGTDALRFALIAAGVRPGDTVVTVPLTFIATTEAISQAGAQPDFVDVDERTYTMDPEKLRAYLMTECTRDVQTNRVMNNRTGRPVTTVVPVHLYGQMADMDPILDLATQFGLTVIEDACQAHGAEYFSRKEGRWRKAGSMGRAAAFSFYPGKNLGACGEAGAITTDDEGLARRCRMLRDHGQSRKYFHDIEGYNGRLDAIQAGVLRVKLRHLAKWNEQRRERAREYDELFAASEGGVIAPHVPSWSRPVYHLYVVRVMDRERLQGDLTAAGIGTGIHYPVPLHLAKPYEVLGFRPGDFPNSEEAAGQILSLPMFPTLSREQQRRVVAEVVQATAIPATAAGANGPLR
jgi:dTDP-4-amino-4,6-dideoxygalactose transaminase/acetyltransferase-like isoleucine patch superfamily enzyme